MCQYVGKGPLCIFPIVCVQNIVLPLSPGSPFNPGVPGDPSEPCGPGGPGGPT